jgi:hypothetical protein
MDLIASGKYKNYENIMALSYFALTEIDENLISDFFNKSITFYEQIKIINNNSLLFTFFDSDQKIKCQKR